MDKVTAPRLVHMVKGNQGYGFNLHGEKNLHAGQTISAVDEGTPGHIGGLLVGDRLVEVNGVNIEICPHSDVVKRIKAGGNEVTMLVVDSVTDAYLKEQGRAITADMANLTTVLPSEKPPTPEPEPETAPEPEPEPEIAPEPEPEPAPEPETITETVETAESSEVVESQPSQLQEDAPEVVETTAEQTESPPAPDERPSEEAGENDVDASKKYSIEVAHEETTPEGVKQLNHVLNAEQHKHEPPTEVAPTRAQANDNNANSDSVAKIEIARQRSIPQRNRVKEKTTESWAEKAKKFQSM